MGSGVIMRNGLTEKGIRAALSARSRRTLSDGGVRGAGALILTTRSTGGGTWYYRHGDRESREEFKIGPCDPKGLVGLSLAQAREKAATLTRLVQSGVQSLTAHFAAEEAARQAADAALREAEARVRQEAERRALRTLRALMTGYAEHLKAQGKPSWRAALQGPEKHVPAEVLGMPAADVRAEHLLPALRVLIDKGHGTTARILRANLRAAFALALSADADPTVPSSLRGFGVELNPIDRIPARGFAKFRRPGERALSWPELIAYRKRVEQLPDGATKDALLLALLLAGQRPAQLVRVRALDVDLFAGTITLRDPKGKRVQPRLHVLPLQGRAKELVERRMAAPLWKPKKKSAVVRPEVPAATRFLLSHRDRHPIDTVRLSRAAASIARAMIVAKEAREGFRGGDIRRTSETLLAGMRVPRDVRAHLLSHGVSGVQAIHYDKHSYMPEMCEVLTEWEARLYSDNVVSLEGKRA